MRATAMGWVSAMHYARHLSESFGCRVAVRGTLVDGRWRYSPILIPEAKR